MFAKVSYPSRGTGVVKVRSAHWLLERLPELGIGIDNVTRQIENEGVMKVSPCARNPAETSMLVNSPRLVTAYYTEAPDPSVPEQRVAFGTLRHRGSAFKKSFNEWHIPTITQAICLYRTQQTIGDPLFLGMDTHALSVPALASALEDKKMGLVAAVLNHRVEQRITMDARKAKMEKKMMKHMHMGKESISQCPMMTGIKSTDETSGDAQKEQK